MNKPTTITTHDGQFHADEVTSCAILNALYPNNNIIRTRKADLITKSDIVVDVGFEYNHKAKRYDHHQKTFHNTFAETSNIPMSSVGLVYKHYGINFISSIVNTKKFKSEDDLIKFYEKVYYNVIAELDANDNGIPQYDTSETPKYFSNTNLPLMINKFNQENIYGKDQEVSFHEAVKYAYVVLKTCIIHYFNKYINFEEDYKLISELLDKRYELSKTGEFFVVNQDCNNWLQCIMKYEKEHPYKKDELSIKFIIYPSDKKWRIKTISDNKKMRHALKPEDELKSKLTHSNKLEFVHKELFIAGTFDVETAIEIAKISIAQ